MSIEMTSKAADFALNIMKENSLDGHVVRLTVDRSSGAYALDIVDEIHENDRKLEFHGVKLVSDPVSYLFAQDAKIDFSDAQGGFVFTPASAR